MDCDGTTSTRRRKIGTIPDNVFETSYSDFENSFMEGYFAKLAERLDQPLYLRFMSLLNELEHNDIVDVYNNVSEMLSTYPDLRSEFLLFLKPGQAMLCDKFDEYLELSQIKDFLYKLNIYFKKCPQQIRKVIDNLCLLRTEPNVTSDVIRNTIVPLLKNHTPLIECFLRLLPNERPPESLFADTDNWEDFNINSENSDSEEIELNETMGGSQCSCSCNSKKAFCCTSHNVNFINGRVYIQKEKILKPAKIIFEGEDENEILRHLVVREEVPKSAKSHKKNESVESTFTESEEEICDAGLSRKRKRKRMNSTKSRKVGVAIKQEIVSNASDNTDETEISDDSAAENNEIAAQREEYEESLLVQRKERYSIPLESTLPPMNRPELSNSELIFTSFADMQKRDTS